MDKQLVTFNKKRKLSVTAFQRAGDFANFGKSVPTSTALNTAKLALKMVSNLKKNREIKFIRTGFAAADIDSTVEFTLLTPVSQGNTENSRDGDKIKLFSMQLSGIFQNKVATQEAAAFRIVIFIDWRQNGIIPAITDIWDSEDDFTNNLVRTSSSNEMSRFTIVYDEFFTVMANTLNIAGTGFSLMFHKINKFYKKISHNVYYKGTGSSIANHGKGNMYMITGSSFDTIELTLETVIKFTDP